MGCIYFVKHNGMDPIKIGYTNNITPATRLIDMKVYAPYDIKLVSWFPHEEANKVEKSLHKRFASVRLRGEWFLITEEMAEQVSREHQPDYDDSVQQARMYIDEAWESEAPIDEVVLIKNKLWNHEMSIRDLRMLVGELVTGRDYKQAIRWVQEYLEPEEWYNQGRGKSTSKGGRRGIKVFIGNPKECLKPSKYTWGAE